MPASAIERASSVCAGESSEHKNSHRPTGSWCRFGIEKAQLCQSYEVCKILVQMRSARLPAFEACVGMRELCSAIRAGRVRATGDRRRLAPSHSASAAAQREQRRWRSEVTPSYLSPIQGEQCTVQVRLYDGAKSPIGKGGKLTSVHSPHAADSR